MSSHGRCEQSGETFLPTESAHGPGKCRLGRNLHEANELDEAAACLAGVTAQHIQGKGRFRAEKSGLPKTVETGQVRR